MALRSTRRGWRGETMMMDQMNNKAGSFCLMFPTEVLLREIADRRFKRDDVAVTYALAITSGETVDWEAVNLAIIGRWSKSALTYIKERAHRLLRVSAAVLP